ncbi:MAG TPA: GDP-L-fucose synthase [Actinomycetota bacterium]|nr:GDP-L-fucose synthase [Actinomycetota bacterium]
MGDFFSTRRVLVTGGSGFLGRALCAKLRERGAADVVVARSRDYDLTQAGAVEKLFADAAPDLVIHLAARVGGIGANQAHPADLYVSNLLMGTHVIEQARLRGVAKTVLLGTICAYPKHTPVPFREESLWDGYPEETNAPYGVAKKALLVHAQANRAQHGQNAIYLLPTNLYGPGDKFNPSVSHVIPALIKKCVDARARGDDAIDVWGTGRATREFLYVDDCAEGIVAAAERYDDAEPVNLGTGREVPVRELVETIARLTGFDGELRWDASKPDGQPRRCLDTTRARERFGWRAEVDLEDGLRRTIEWYVAHRAEAEAATF